MTQQKIILRLPMQYWKIVDLNNQNIFKLYNGSIKQK